MIEKTTKQCVINEVNTLLVSTLPFMSHINTPNVTLASKCFPSLPYQTDSIYDEENQLLPHIQPYTKDATTLRINHPLMVMVRNDQEDLLTHPLVTSLLNHKWGSFGRFFYYGNLMFYMLFLTFLTGYIVVTNPPYFYQ